MKTLYALLLILIAPFGPIAIGQTATIPANSMTFTGTINGVAVSLTGPTMAVTVNVAGVTGSLPAGMTYSASTGLAVTGGVTATGIVTGSELAVTGGTAVPTNCANSLLVLQYAAATNVLTPVCLPPITVSQASPGGPITLTP